MSKVATPPVADPRRIDDDDDEPPELLRAFCPNAGETVVMDYVRIAPVNATSGAWGKYVAPWYDCPACDEEHQATYHTFDARHGEACVRCGGDCNGPLAGKYAEAHGGDGDE